MADAKAVVKALEEFSAKVVKAITLEITSNLIKSTPVDTGWARANWVPSVGTPAGGTVGSPRGVSAGAQAAGQAKVAGYKITQGNVFITNNVPYILRLNDGSSTQAPSGFIQQAIARGIKAGAKVRE
jgi:hypothetical protein